MASAPPPPCRILYFGLPLGALVLAEAGFPPVAVGIGHRRTPGARRLRRTLGRRGALLLGRPDLGAPAVLRTLRTVRPDALLSWFWPHRIPPRVLALAPGRAFGVHPSLLPRWRGPDPYFWTLDAGDRETGVTLHRLTDTYDAGDIVARRRIAVSPDDDAWSLARRLDRPGLDLLVRCADALWRGAPLEGTAQNEAEVTHAPVPEDDILSIDFHRDADAIVRRVRAAAPRPGAVCDVRGTVVTVLRASRADVRPPPALRPAEAVRTDSGVVVQTGDGVGVRLDEVSLPDGTLRSGVAVCALLD